MVMDSPLTILNAFSSIIQPKAHIKKQLMERNTKLREIRFGVMSPFKVRKKRTTQAQNLKELTPVVDICSNSASRSSSVWSRMNL